MNTTTFTGAAIFDGRRIYRNHSLTIVGDRIRAIVEINDTTDNNTVISNQKKVELKGGMLIPGLVDLQVNGGGGVLLNDNPSVDSIKTICDTHARFGTTSLLPTLITATHTLTQQAVGATIDAFNQNAHGLLGLHLEGPHLSIAKKGAHNASLIRLMTEDDLRLYLYAKENLPNLLITVAPESVTNQQINTLTKAGITVSLGHSNANYEQCMSAFDAGATCATHLYNAMSPLTHRAPGLVGAALTHSEVFCGLIADGHHVHTAAIKHALAAKQKDYPIYLVSDAMSVAGTHINSFELDGRRVFRKGGRLVLSDGTLAGADISLIDAIRFMVKSCDLEPEEAIRMATLYPARCLGNDQIKGTLEPEHRANVVHLTDDLEVLQVWRNGLPLLAG